MVGRHLGGNRVSSVFKAAVLGVPLPLCSCAVLPAAAELRRQGAGKGAVTAFLISTPESGVDSIAVTWALLDSIMTVLRPLAAFLTAAAAGLITLFREDEERSGPVDSADLLQKQESPCREDTPLLAEPALLHRVREVFRYGFGDLMEDIGPWFAVGVLLAGIINAVLPAELIPKKLRTGLTAMLATLLVSAPLYVCATASTPILASLTLKGLSPGAALVFLLAGPARRKR